MYIQRLNRDGSNSMRMITKGYLKTFEGALLHMLLRVHIDRVWKSSPLTHEMV